MAVPYGEMTFHSHKCPDCRETRACPDDGRCDRVRTYEKQCASCLRYLQLGAPTPPPLLSIGSATEALAQIRKLPAYYGDVTQKAVQYRDLVARCALQIEHMSGITDFVTCTPKEKPMPLFTVVATVETFKKLPDDSQLKVEQLITKQEVIAVNRDAALLLVGKALPATTDPQLIAAAKIVVTAA